jgi:hypothetical protein
MQKCTPWFILGQKDIFYMNRKLTKKQLKEIQTPFGEKRCDKCGVPYRKRHICYKPGQQEKEQIKIHWE